MLPEETYSPGTPLQEPNDTVSHQTSVQPESEEFPEQLTTPINTPSQHSQHELMEPNTSFGNLPEGNEDNAIDLDEISLLADQSAEIMTCHDLCSSEEIESIHEWNSFQPGVENCDICLAEDGLPYLNEPMQPHDHQCYLLELPLSRQDIVRWSQSERPEELAQVASASKRARAEVQLKDLSAEDKKLFSLAKEAEISCWLQTSALKPVLRKHLNPEQILKSRWVLTWKNMDTADSSGNSKKAKARLVVLGYQDPGLTEVQRDAPTLTREGRHTVLQWIASYQWTLTSFDIKTAFLRGKADSDNPLAMEPPKELLDRMQLESDQVRALIGNANGRVDAPLLFYKELSKQLKNLGFTMHPLEPCVHYLESWKVGHRTLHGVLGTRVDDGICGGDEYFLSRIEKLRQSLPFGSFTQPKFVFTGIQLEQLPDHSIRANQRDYIRAIPSIEVGKHRRSHPQEAINDQEWSNLRGLIGSLQYATTHTRPDVAAKLGESQVQLSRPTVSTLLEANKVLRAAQQTEGVSICFRAIPVKDVTHVVFGDASFATVLSRHDGFCNNSFIT